MTTFGILFVQKRPVKDGYQNFVQNCTVREHGEAKSLMLMPIFQFGHLREVN